MTAALATWQDARIITFTGPKLKDFLQGYLTCSTERMDAGHWIATALCTVKGRVVMSGWVKQFHDAEVRLLLHASLAQSTVTFLTPYARFARCEMTVDPRAPRVAQSDSGDIVGRWQPADPDDERNADDQDVSDRITWDLAAAEYAFVSAPVSEQFLPQMLNLDQHSAVDFDKGCYLGQEVVARAQFRGAVKRHLQSVAWQSAPPNVGDKWQDHGTVISVARSPENPQSGIALTVK